MFFNQKQLSVEQDPFSLLEIRALYNPHKFGAKGHILSMTYITCLVTHCTIKS